MCVDGSLIEANVESLIFVFSMVGCFTNLPMLNRVNLALDVLYQNLYILPSAGYIKDVYRNSLSVQGWNQMTLEISSNPMMLFPAFFTNKLDVYSLWLPKGGYARGGTELEKGYQKSFQKRYAAAN